jgi:hypothetical protein
MQAMIIGKPCPAVPHRPEMTTTTMTSNNKVR